MKFEVLIDTAGDSLWSGEEKTVQCTKATVPYIDDEESFGELRVYFDTASWDVHADGLIYTDSLFIKELKQVLGELGFNTSDISYSEQGMQGDNYVSLDVGKHFIDSWNSINV